MTQKNSDNKSLYLYTGLIFLVAIVMIVVSFFAQKHFENLRVIEIGAENVSLSNKAAQVSEENLQLVELNRLLKLKNTDLTTQNTELTTERDTLLKEKEAYKALISVYQKIVAGKEKAAKELLLNIYTEDLSSEQKEIYDALAKKIKIN